MSLPPEELRSVQATWRFLLELNKGEHGVNTVGRQLAHDILRHFPLGGDLEDAARKAAPELLGKVEREATQLAHEAARESARADKAEKELAAIHERAATIPDYLNVP